MFSCADAVSGGDGSDPQPAISSAEKFDENTASWSFIAALSPARFGVAVAAAGGFLFAIGGAPDAASYDQAYNTDAKYDPSTNTWTPIASRDYAAYWMGAAGAQPVSEPTTAAPPISRAHVDTRSVYQYAYPLGRRATGTGACGGVRRRSSGQPVCAEAPWRPPRSSAVLCMCMRSEDLQAI